MNVIIEKPPGIAYHLVILIAHWTQLHPGTISNGATLV